jgi:hypothetical protein
MGVVYLAHDSRLERNVAIKALPEHLAIDSERLTRFQQEARALAALNHSNVASIYGMEEHDGHQYLVLEYVEGETLADVLDRGPMPIDEALETALQVAAGVEAAHNANVIHRDLKPGNIMITAGGAVKVLDFGLAKTGDASSTSFDPDAATRHSPTTPGAILGTASYMSPEQARGQSIDKRTDIWSFGVVFYEMLTGVGPFAGETATDSIGAVLHKDVDLSKLAHAPPDVHRVVQHCLRRNKDERLRDIGDARIDLTDALDQLGEFVPMGEHRSAATRSRRVGPLAIAVCLIVGAVIGAMLMSRLGSQDVPPRVVHVEFQSPPETTLVYTGDLASPAVVSPDGTHVVFGARDADGRRSLWLRSLNAPEAEELRGTENSHFPFWSPDGRSIGFFAGQWLKRIDLAARSIRNLCPATDGRGGTWTADGTILFAPTFRSSIHSVPDDGGDPVPVTTVDETRHTSHRWPFALPDGRRFLFIAIHHDPGRQSDNTIMLGSLDGGDPVPLMHGDFAVEVVDDSLLMVRDSVLFAVPFDPVKGIVTGDPIGIVQGVAGDLSTWRAAFSASRNDVLVYHRSSQRDEESLAMSEANVSTVIMRNGRPVYTRAEGLPQNSVGISPDGTSLAISAVNTGETDYDVWIHGIADPSQSLALAWTSQTTTRVTFAEGTEVNPIFSPDGGTVVFGRIYGSSGLGIVQKRVGGGREELLLEKTPDGPDLVPEDWSNDGRFIVFTKGKWISDRQDDLWVLPLDGGEPFPLVEAPGDDNRGQLSPNGRWLAYSADGSGTPEVVVIPFPPGWEDEDDAPPMDARWRVSIAGGITPRWSDTGDELFYLALSESLIAVAVQTDGVTFVHDTGTALFEMGVETGTDYGVFPGAQAFIVNSVAEKRDTAISLVLNWRSLLDG